jgi:outer membrane protein assembly factor BamD
MFLKLDALYMYAQKSIPTKQVERYQAALDDYYSFIEEFPQTKYSKNTAKIFQATTKFLKIETTGTQTASN